MQLTLDDGEINQAITDYVGNQGVDVFGKKVTIVFKNGRKGKDGAPGSGSTATVNVENDDVEVPSAPNFDDSVAGE